MIDKETGEVILPFVRHPFNYDADRVSAETALRCGDPTRTSQEFKEECDINTIVERFGITGELPEPGSVKAPLEGDFVDVHDFQSALNVVRQAEEAFMAMPADVRTEFNNDPGRFMAFVNDPSNLERAVKLGIAVPRETPKVPDPVLVRVVADDSPLGAMSAVPKGGGSTSST